MNVGEIISWAQQQLSDFDQPNLEAEVLLISIFECSRADLKSHPEKILTTEQELLYKDFIQKRKEHWPIDYILGYADWSDFRLKVSPDVLIPRDETETLCHHILKSPRDFSPQTLVDVGTGSGAIALFLSQNFPQARVWGLDISELALSIARANAEKYSLPTQFLQSDLLDNWEGEIDILVANLPYVPARMDLSPEVRCEPDLALFGGEDGLDLIRRLSMQITEKNISFRELWLEFLPQQQENIHEIFADYAVEFLTDVGGEVFFAKIT